MSRFITLVAGVFLATVLTTTAAFAEWNEPGKSGQGKKSISPGQALIWALTLNTPETTDIVQARDCTVLRLHSIKTAGTLAATAEICSETEDPSTTVCGTTGVTMDGTATVAGHTFSAPVYRLRVDITTCSGGCAGLILLTCDD